jgi:hypothetical protein
MHQQYTCTRKTILKAEIFYTVFESIRAHAVSKSSMVNGDTTLNPSSVVSSGMTQDKTIFASSRKDLRYRLPNDCQAFDEQQ